jgi:alanyl-tRNA synthetase
VHELAGVRFLIKEVPPVPASELRTIADTLRGKLGAGLVFLVTRDGEKVSLVATVAQEQVGRLHAGELVKAAAAVVGGGGGGRPDFAQAGGRDGAKIPEALREVERQVRDRLS